MEKNLAWKVFLLTLFTTFSSLAQQRELTGTVTDPDGMPLPGVAVSIENSTGGTVTDFEGAFSLTITQADDVVLVFSYLGFETQRVPVGNQTSFSITLQEDLEALEEVVVVGYGSTRREDLTSAVSSLESDDFVQGSVSPMMAIQGKVPGLTIQSSNGADPNAEISVQLRGINSVNASQGPLIVIDGVPGGNLSTVVKEDIASIEVLRDASAAAIYGTRASGGVILITTKQAESGALQVNYTGELFLETVRRYAEPLSAEQFVADGIGPDLGHRTDWFEEVTNDLPLTYRNVVSFSGGIEDAQIRATVSNQNAEGLGIGSARENTQARLNTSFQLFDGFVEIINNLSYSEVEAEFGSNAAFRMALQLNPTET